MPLLRKMAYETPQPDMTTPHDVRSYEGGINKIETFQVPDAERTDRWKGDRPMFHHVVHKYDPIEEQKDPSFHRSVIHMVGWSPDPFAKYQTAASSAAGILPDGSVKHGETISRHPGSGVGTVLYNRMLQYHGKMLSDHHVSPAANKVWDKVLAQPHVTGDRGAPDTPEPHLAQTSRPFSEKPLAVVKLNGLSRDSLDRLIANPDHRMLEETENGYKTMRAYHFPDGQHAPQAAEALESYRAAKPFYEGAGLLQKGAKEMLLAASLAMPAAATVPSSDRDPEPAPPATAPATFEIPESKKWNPKGLVAGLHPIAHLESSFGENLKHADHSKGDWHTAHGAVGFKPITAHEEYIRSPLLQQIYPGLHEHATFQAKFKADDKFYNEVASSHWNRLRKRFGSDAKAAFAWRWGWGSAVKASDQQVAEDKYVQSYLKPRGAPLKKAIADIKPGKPVAPPQGAAGNGQWHNYSHLLPVSARKNAQLLVHHSLADGVITAQYRVAGAGTPGQVSAQVSDNRLSMGMSRLRKMYRGKGIGSALYEAVLGHAHQHGATEVVGGTHSTMAHRVHASLARKHNLQYSGKMHQGMEDVEPGPEDDRFQRYSYDLK